MHTIDINANYWHKHVGTRVYRVRRSGQTKLWKTRPEEFRIPVKYGLYHSLEITHTNQSEWRDGGECHCDIAYEGQGG